MVYGAWWRTLQMRSLLVFADLAHPASWPNAHPSPCYFFQGYTIFPKPAEQVLLLFNEKHQISPFSFSAYGFFLNFFFNFWRAEKHEAATSSPTGSLHPPAKHPALFPAGTVSRRSRHGLAHHPITTHVLQGPCQYLWAASDTLIFQKL